MRYTFDGFDLDPDAYKLARGGREIHLQPLVFDVLHYLIRNRERIVSKEELLDALWEDGTGNDAAVTWSISHVRRALEQTRWQKAPIETLHGRGYRFVAELTTHDSVPPPVAAALAEPPAFESQLPFVGRSEVMDQLQAQLAAAEKGAGNLTVLVGEAGIGKTRVATELARNAEARGFLVLSASSVEGVGAPVFHPWQQVVRGLSQVEQRLRQPANALLAQLTAAFQGMSGPRSPDTQSTVTSNRVRLFDCAVQLLLEAARLIPLLLLFDDLHWADAGSIELLAFAAPELVLGRCMVLGTRREVSSPHNERALAGLARRGQHLPLSYLTSADVARYIAEVAHDDPPPALSAAVLAASAGNPLFMQETVRSLLAGRAPASLQSAPPSAVQPSKVSRDVLRIPLSALDREQLQLISTASVLGETFELTLLKHVTGLEIDTLLDQLETARQLAIVLAVAPNRYKFRHALIRTILYDDMAPAERVAVHRRAAEYLSKAADGAQRQSEIAIHYYNSLPAGNPAAVTRATLDAAQAAEDVHAFEDAAMFYLWAVEAQQRDTAAGPRARADVLVRCGHAQRLAGREEEARRTLEAAIELASNNGFADLLVKAAGILRPTAALSTVPDELVQSALERALRTAPPGPHPQRIHALSQLACMPPVSNDMERSKEMAALALSLARERRADLEQKLRRGTDASAAHSGEAVYDPLSYARVNAADGRSTLLEALRANLYSLSGPDDIEALLATCDEILALDQPRTDVSWRAHMSRYEALIARGELRAARNALEAAGHLGAELNLPEARWNYERHRAQNMLLEGRFAEARVLLKGLRAKSVQMGLGYGPILINMVRGALEWEQRGGPAMRSHVSVWDSQAKFQNIPSVGAYSARLAVESGARDIGEQTFAKLARRDFTDVPKQQSYLLTLCNAGLTAIALGDRARAEILYEMLSPYPEHNTPDVVILQHGSVSRYLALLAAATSRSDRVERHFETALAMNERLPHLPQLAKTQYEYARWLLARGDAAARDYAGRLAAKSVQLSDEMGMKWLQSEAEALVS